MNRLLKRATGPEYDLLRLLPPEERERVWRECFMRASWTWRGLIACGLLTGCMILSGLLFKVCLGAGFGWGLLAAAGLGVLDHWVLVRGLRYTIDLARPFVREELAAIAVRFTPFDGSGPT